MKKIKGIKKTKNTRSALRVEALEQRQLLAGITGGGTEVLSNLVHANGNVYDQVLMNGSSVTVTADAGQITRVSFLDLQGDIVQAEFSGAGSMTITLDTATGAGYAKDVAPSKYLQSGVLYSQGLASFTVQGSDASTNVNFFTVGKSTAVNQALFDSTHTGGNNTADVARLTIVANPANPNGSTFGSIFAGNTVFTSNTDSVGPIGITAANVAVQGTVTIGDIDAKSTATIPTLKFGANSQFGVVKVAGGDLVQTNALAIDNTNSVAYQINLAAGQNSAGTALPAQSIPPALSFTASNPFSALNKSFDLTTGIDTFAGATGNDTFTGSGTGDRLSALDSLDGGDGTDTLVLSKSDGGIVIPTNATVKNIETVSLASTGNYSGDISAWTGLKTVQVSNSIKDAVSNSDLKLGTVDLTVATTQTNTGGATTFGTTTITGGKTVSVTSTMAGTTNNVMNTNGKITVTGGTGTTSVVVDQTNAPQSATSSRPGYTNAEVDVIDSKGNASTATITDVTLRNLGTGSDIKSGKLANLTIKGGASNSGTLAIDNANVTTLNLTLDAASVGTITDSQNKYSTLNVNTTGTGNSSVSGWTSTGLTTLAVSGSRVATFSAAFGPEITSVTVSGTGAGLSANFAAATALPTVDASAATGSNTITVNPVLTSYAGGSGSDTVTIANNPLKAIAGGAGTDTLVLNLSSTVLANPSGNANITGFETLSIGSSGVGTYDATGFTAVRLGAVAGAVTFDKVAAGTPLTISAATGSGVSYKLADDSGAADVLNVTISNNAQIANVGTITAANIESVKITNNDGDTTANAGVNAATLVATKATSVTLSGSTGMNLTNAGNTSITSFDASGVTVPSHGSATLSAVTYVSATTSGSVTIKGGAGNDSLTGTAADDTIEGGDGNDTISAGDGTNTVTGGAGDDTVTVGTGKNVVDVGDGNDTVTFGASADDANSVKLGAGTNTLNAGATTGKISIEGGDGSDTITLGTGASTVTLGNGNDTVTSAAGNAKNTITGGIGAGTKAITLNGTGDHVITLPGIEKATVTVGSGAVKITTGAGNDYITVDGAANTKLPVIDVGSGTDSVRFATIQAGFGYYTSLTGINAGDKIALGSVAGTALPAGALGSKLVLGPAAETFQNYVNLAASNTGGAGAALAKWFQFGGNTYLVVDNSNSATFDNGVDTVIEIKGLVDLENSTIGAGDLNLDGDTTDTDEAADVLTIV